MARQLSWHTFAALCARGLARCCQRLRYTCTPIPKHNEGWKRQWQLAWRREQRGQVNKNGAREAGLAPVAFQSTGKRQPGRPARPPARARAFCTGGRERGGMGLVGTALV